MEADLWITHHAHPNIVAVAVLRNLAGVIIAGNQEPDPETKNKAESHGIPLLLSGLPAFELVGRLYQLGIRSGELKR